MRTHQKPDSMPAGKLYSKTLRPPVQRAQTYHYASHYENQSEQQPKKPTDRKRASALWIEGPAEDLCTCNMPIVADDSNDDSKDDHEGGCNRRGCSATFDATCRSMRTIWLSASSTSRAERSTFWECVATVSTESWCHL